MRRCFPLRPSWLAAALVVITIAASPLNLRAGGRAASTHILLLCPKSDLERVAELFQTIIAHFSDFRASIGLARTETLPYDFSAQLEAARIVALETRALAVVWLDLEHRVLHILVSPNAAGKPPGVSDEQLLTRSIPDSGAGWSADSDTIATLLRSVLAPWLDSIVRDPKRPAFMLQAVDFEAPWNVKRKLAPLQFTPKPVTEVTLLMTGAYAMQLVNEDKPQNVGAVSLGCRIGHLVAIDVGVDFPQPIEGRGPAELHRLPFRLGLSLLRSVDRFELGLKVGALLDVARIVGLSQSATKDDIHKLNPGAAVALLVRVSILSWIAGYIEIGADAYRHTLAFHNLEDKTVAEYAGWQPRFLVGLNLLLPLASAASR